VRSPFRGQGHTTLGVLVGLAVVATLWILRAPARDPARDTDRPLAALTDGYRSSSACRACHPQPYDSWYGSYHRRMTQLATPSAVLGVGDQIDLDLAGRRYRIGREGDGYWLDLATASESPVRRRVVMTTGSHHRQWLWFATGEGRRIAALPFLYLIEERRWVPRVAAFMQPPEPEWSPTYLKGLWDAGCVACHATHGERSLEQGEYAELGIACEACHGPGSAHVAANGDPRHRYAQHLAAGSDPTIVNPRRLDGHRASEVCGKCHSMRDVTTVDSTGGTDAKIEASRWPDGRSRCGGREFDAVSATPCYRNGELSCLSCHAMHRGTNDARPLAEWADDQLAPRMDQDHACLQCHDKTLAAPQHTHHAAESPGSRCYNCHMPYTSYALLKAIRNHQVEAPTVQESVQHGRPNACNLCHLDRSLGWTARQLKTWYGTPAPPLTEDQDQVAAAVLWAAAGDAGQRALVAWHMGWAPAQQASGQGWLAPYLTLLMNDPYPAVRAMAHRSLKRLPRFDDLAFDYVGPDEQRQAALRRAVQIWRREPATFRGIGDRVLVDPGSGFRQERLQRLLERRDDRPVVWVE
jgi:hypothetical protein